MKYFEHTYFNTYYYSNIISNILSGHADLLGFISNFFSDKECVFTLARPFPKKSAFHYFIESVISDFFQEEMHEYDENVYDSYKHSSSPLGTLYADSVFQEYDKTDHPFMDFIADKSPIEYSDIEAYHEDLLMAGYLEELFEIIANEVFYIMFNNREILLQFNQMVSNHMDIYLEDVDHKYKKLFTKNGTLKRAKIPEWCKRAVYFRDRGHCCLCPKDLSGILNISNERNFDHIVPLASYGLNDISNLQLLCAECNAKKNKHFVETSNRYESWY